MHKEFLIPIQVISESNTKEHWRKSHKRHKDHKFAVKMHLMARDIEAKLPVVVTMTRLSPRKLDSDNLQSAFKYVRDAIAEYFIPGKAPGRADDDIRFMWRYEQECSKDKCIRVRFDWE